MNATKVCLAQAGEAENGGGERWQSLKILIRANFAAGPFCRETNYTARSVAGLDAAAKKAGVCPEAKTASVRNVKRVATANEGGSRVCHNSGNRQRAGETGCKGGRKMPDLTDRQRRDLREMLCDDIAEHLQANGYAWRDRPSAADRCKFMATSGYALPFVNRFFVYVGLLGEWPVGYRGEGGWEKLQITPS